MCYGGLDTKYITRDIEARVKPVAAAQKKSEEAPVPASGFFARLRSLLGMMKRKGALHV